MGCDCGKWLKDADETGCQQEMELELEMEPPDGKRKSRGGPVGGCHSGYLPWVVWLHMSGETSFV